MACCCLFGVLLLLLLSRDFVFFLLSLLLLLLLLFLHLPLLLLLLLPFPLSLLLLLLLLLLIPLLLLLLSTFYPFFRRNSYMEHPFLLFGPQMCRCVPMHLGAVSNKCSDGFDGPWVHGHHCLYIPCGIRGLFVLFLPVLHSRSF